MLPKFPKHVKFRHNKARDEWVILAPERLVKLDDIAVEILQLVDGVARVMKFPMSCQKNLRHQRNNSPRCYGICFKNYLIKDLLKKMDDIKNKI